MPGITPQIVVSVLRERELARVNFRMRDCRVYHSGFHTIARAVHRNRISVTEVPYAPDMPGSHHHRHETLTPHHAVYNYGEDGFFFPLSPEFMREQAAEDDITYGPSVRAQIESIYGEGYLEQHTQLTVTRKALIIHEAVHALQDYNRLTLPNYIVEGAAYVAQMMYWQMHHVPIANDVPVLREAYIIGTRLLGGGYQVTEAEIETIRTALGGMDLYRADNDLETIFNGI